jgi:hypothetical protein
MPHACSRPGSRQGAWVGLAGGTYQNFSPCTVCHETAEKTISLAHSKFARVICSRQILSHFQT